MDEISELYTKYLENNEDEDSQMSELEFCKSAFNNAMEEMDNLRQVCVFII